MQNPILPDLLTLSHELGREDRGLAMLGEGNTSARLGERTFLVKASGTCLGTLKEVDVVECLFPALLPLLEKDNLTDQQVDDALLAARVDPVAKSLPSKPCFTPGCFPCPASNLPATPMPPLSIKSSVRPARRILPRAACFPTKSSVAAPPRSSFPTPIPA